MQTHTHICVCVCIYIYRHLHTKTQHISNVTFASKCDTITNVQGSVYDQGHCSLTALDSKTKMMMVLYQTRMILQILKKNNNKLSYETLWSQLCFCIIRRSWRIWSPNPVLIDGEEYGTFNVPVFYQKPTPTARWGDKTKRTLL